LARAVGFRRPLTEIGVRCRILPISDGKHRSPVKNQSETIENKGKQQKRLWTARIAHPGLMGLNPVGIR
jgi:hypothetical protein